MSDHSEDCIFCKISSGSLGTHFVAESEHVVAFDDITPVAPAHVLVVPKKHIESVNDLRPSESGLLAEMFEIVRRAAEAKGVTESGYRVVTNAGPDSGQEVQHLHLHVLGGRKLGHLG
jgi:histidine triad (HIT) family protein